MALLDLREHVVTSEPTNSSERLGDRQQSEQERWASPALLLLCAFTGWTVSELLVSRVEESKPEE
jgi:hypothetical protein